MRRCYVQKSFNDEHLRIIRRADTVASEYAAQGYDLTLRQLYYQFVARGWIANKQSEYKRLGSIVNDARMAGLLDWSQLVDRTRSLRELPHWETPADIIRGAAQQFRLEKWDDQPTRVEVWVEKEALAGVVQRIANQLDVPWFACRGYVSQSELWNAAQRLGEHMAGGQNVVVLHLGDHDPSGIDMTRDNLDRLELFTQRDFLHDLVDGGQVDGTDSDELLLALKRREADGPTLEVRRIALNMDQVIEYDPPPNPAKLTDSRAGGYLAEHGRESWELDALPPDVLADLIREHVEAERDDDLWNEHSDAEDRHRELLAEASRRWPELVEQLEAS